MNKGIEQAHVVRKARKKPFLYVQRYALWEDITGRIIEPEYAVVDAQGNQISQHRTARGAHLSLLYNRPIGAKRIIDL